MFIELLALKILRSSRSEMFVSTYLAVYCAPLERQTVVSRDVYKHLAPLEPEHITQLCGPRR